MRPKSLYASSSRFLPPRHHFLEDGHKLSSQIKPATAGSIWLGKGARGGDLFLCLLGTLAAGGLEQEPAALLCLVDKVLEQAGGRYIFVLVRDFVLFTEIRNYGLVVVHQLHQHGLRRNKFLIVVLDPLQAGDLPD